MGKKSNITDEQLQEMFRLYSEGKTIKDISILLGVTYNTTVYQLRKAGKIVKRQKYTPEAKLKAKQLLMCGKTYKEVSSLTGIKDGWLRKNLPKHKYFKTRKIVLKYRGKSIPCNIIDCSDRKECRERETPQNCLVWQLVYGKE